MSAQLAMWAKEELMAAQMAVKNCISVTLNLRRFGFILVVTMCVHKLGFVGQERELRKVLSMKT